MMEDLTLSKRDRQLLKLGAVLAIAIPYGILVLMLVYGIPE